MPSPWPRVSAMRASHAHGDAHARGAPPPTHRPSPPRRRRAPPSERAALVRVFGSVSRASQLAPRSRCPFVHDLAHVGDRTIGSNLGGHRSSRSSGRRSGTAGARRRPFFIDARDGERQHRGNCQHAAPPSSSSCDAAPSGCADRQPDFSLVHPTCRASDLQPAPPGPSIRRFMSTLTSLAMSRLGFFGACACLAALGGAGAAATRRTIRSRARDTARRPLRGARRLQLEICALLHHHKPARSASCSREKGLDARLTEDEVAAFIARPRARAVGGARDGRRHATRQLRRHGRRRPLSLKEIVDATAVAKDDVKVRKEFWDAMRKCAKLSFVHLPVLSVVCSVVFGGMLALVEVELRGLLLPRARRDHVDRHQDHRAGRAEGAFGKIVGCLVDLLSLAVFGGIAGIFSGPLLDPILARTRLRPTTPSSTSSRTRTRPSSTSCATAPSTRSERARAARREDAVVRARHDGGVSVGWLCRKLVQHRAGVRGMFDELDMDGNGSLSRDELGEGSCGSGRGSASRRSRRPRCCAVRGDRRRRRRRAHARGGRRALPRGRRGRPAAHPDARRRV